MHHSLYAISSIDADEGGQDPVEEGVSYEAANIHIITQCLVLMMCVQPAKLFNQPPMELYVFCMVVLCWKLYSD